MELADGVHQIKVPIPSVSLKYVNAYLIENNGCYALVDPGWPNNVALSSLEKGLKGLGLSIEDISFVVATHRHPDHLGLAGELRRSYKTEVVLHEADLPVQASIMEYETAMGSWLMRNGMPKDKINLKTLPLDPGEFPWRASPTRWVKDGDRLFVESERWVVIWTPGHSPGHLCLYDAECEMLLSGDHILPKITSNVSLNPYSEMSDPLGTYLNSLDKLCGLKVKIVLPGHEEPFWDFEQRLAEIKVHHNERINDLLACAKDGEKTAYEIACELCWNSIGSKAISGRNLPTSEQPLAVGETLAHIAVLMNEGKLQKKRKYGLDVFCKS